MKHFIILYKQLLFILLGIVIFSNCTDYEEFNPYATTGDVQDLFEVLDTINKSILEINPTIENTIKSNSSVIEMFADFILDNQSQVYDDICTMKYMTSSTKANLIFNDIETSHNGALITIDDLIYLDVFANEQYLKMDPENPISVKIPQVDFQNASQLYKLNPEVNYDWILSGSEQLNFENWQIDGTTVEGYHFYPKSFGWRALGHIVGGELRDVDMCVRLPEYFDSNNTVVFAVFDNYNSVIKLEGEEQSSLFCESSILKPLGDSLSIISLSTLGDDNFYYGINRTVIGKSIDLKIVPDRYSISQMIETLKQL